MNRREFLGLVGSGGLALFNGDGVVRPASFRPRAAGDAPAATRWALVIDVEKCLAEKGCTRCIAACHAAHNVPGIAEPRHQVRWVAKADYEHVFPEAVHAYANNRLQGEPLPVLCNHCDKPPCTRVCPTRATWKRDDGIVMMDPHRCIGCRYCVAACPYGSRSFNWTDPRPHIGHVTPDYPARTKGVVEKCTFCEERLARAQLPLCVEACPGKALLFGNLEDEKSGIRAALRSRHAIRRRPELGTGPGVFYLIP